MMKLMQQLFDDDHDYDCFETDPTFADSTSTKTPDNKILFAICTRQIKNGQSHF